MSHKANLDSAHQNPWAIGEVVFGIPFFAGLGMNAFLPIAIFQGVVRQITLVLGIVLVLAGVRVIVLARREFTAYRQPTDPGQPTGKIITGGVFSRSRNPLYLAAGFVFLGLGLSLNIGWCLVMLAFSLVLCHYVLILPEERYLAQKFGEEYAAYTNTVHRWLGRK